MTEPGPWDDLPWMDEWTEVVRTGDALEDVDAYLALDRGCEDPAAVRPLLQELLRQHGIDVDDLDFSTDVRVVRCIRQTGGVVRQFHEVQVRTERLPGAR